MTYAQAAALLEGEVCVWCETRAKATTSHLCDECREQDVTGVFSRSADLVAVAPAG
jgi:hypothetical protein